MKVKKTLTVVLFPILLLLWFLSYGQAFAGLSSYLGYRVQTDDTMWLLSQRYGTSVDDIKVLNQSKGNSLNIGQFLQIPVQQEGEALVYRVQPGDSLFLIGLRHALEVSAIKKLNGIDDDRLDAGQSLLVPIAGQGCTAYRVASGDTLFILANRFHTSMEQLKLINRLDSSQLLQGQLLQVPETDSVSFKEGLSDRSSGVAVRSDRSLVAYTFIRARGDFVLREEQAYSTFDTLEKIMGETFKGRWTPDLTESGVDYLYLRKVGETLGYSVVSSSDTLIFYTKAQSATITPEPAPPPAQSVDQPDLSDKEGDTSGLTLYRVASGDTLDTLALRYGTTVSAISQTNVLHSDIVMPGQPLYIPEGRAEPVKVEGPKGETLPGYGELLDWEWARWIYNPGCVATVIDFYSRNTFQVRCLGGSNHADTEPLTSADTATMKALFGGAWSWARRPILLNVNGRVLAASMFGMPHDVDTITDNDFPGHFCLYFYNSLGHASGAIDPEHQANVLMAAGKK